MATAYEWVVEEMHGEDVEDTHCFDSLKEAKASLDAVGCLALRKLKSNRDVDSVDSFAYAYLANGKLPEKFDDGSAVPARYMREATDTFPVRGRPFTGKAKTQAQLQREYRARKKELGLPTFEQALSGFEVWYLPKGCRKWRKHSGHDALSWHAAHSYLSGVVQVSKIVPEDFEEHAARYEIRPAR